MITSSARRCCVWTRGSPLHERCESGNGGPRRRDRDALTTKYIAILELVKNSIGAGAANARIKFARNACSPPYAKAIADDSSRMNKEDVEEKCMNVAKSDKRTLLESIQPCAPV